MVASIPDPEGITKYIYKLPEQSSRTTKTLKKNLQDCHWGRNCPINNDVSLYLINVRDTEIKLKFVKVAYLGLYICRADII